ncbi:hypothetical protein LR48_Vigan03g172800 [Vigna angularis]|uniref:Uncharacterized protein n=1 Tax=Phaseolus angularis TaxID=3914 RepID=A0A0L9U6E8_PHAAN|nr:hypothetical protein LR48_Vigan03g172800 [Vigna angularis]
MVRARKARKLHSLFSLSHAEPRTQAMGVAACTGNDFSLGVEIRFGGSGAVFPRRVGSLSGVSVATKVSACWHSRGGAWRSR